MTARTWWSAGFCLALQVSVGHAATDAQRLLKQDIDRREQERREQRWDEQHATLPVTPPSSQPPSLLRKPDAGKAVPSTCFKIDRITLSPEGVLPRRATLKIIGSYEGLCLGSAELLQLQRALNAEALRSGLATTRVVIPEQNLATGELKLQVWPGRMEAIHAPALTPQELRMVTPAEPGDLLQLRALEQTVDNLNRLASQQADIELKPGRQPGGSVAEVQVRKSAPWQVGLSFQGEAINGEASDTVRGSLTLDSPIKLQDRLVLGVNASLKDGSLNGAKGGSADYDMPFGWWHFSVGGDRFSYESPLTAAFTRFTASGESKSWRAEVSRMLFRSASDRLGLALHNRQRVSSNYIDDVFLATPSNRIKAWGLRSDYSHVAASWILDATVDAESGEGHNRARTSPIDAGYSRLLFSSRLQYRLEPVLLSAILNGQWSDARLAASEQFTLTGQVPGFSPQLVNANSGMAMALEGSWPVYVNRGGLSRVHPALGMRYALAPDMGSNDGRAYLGALTAALTAPWPHAQARMGLAFPLKSSDILDPGKGWQLDASLSLQW